MLPKLPPPKKGCSIVRGTPKHSLPSSLPNNRGVLRNIIVNTSQREKQHDDYYGFHYERQIDEMEKSKRKRDSDVSGSIKSMETFEKYKTRRKEKCNSYGNHDMSWQNQRLISEVFATPSSSSSTSPSSSCSSFFFEKYNIKNSEADNSINSGGGGGGGYDHFGESANTKIYQPETERELVELEDLINITGPKITAETPEEQKQNHDGSQHRQQSHAQIEEEEEEEEKEEKEEEEKTDAGMTETQREIYDLAMSGESFFFTGAAGTGKSYTLSQVIKGLSEKYADKEGAVKVMAPTGFAAYNVGGCTIHSFASLKPHQSLNPLEYVQNIERGIQANNRNKAHAMWAKYTKKRWRDCRVIIIDEISMVGSSMFDFLECAARLIKKNNKPFGGIQLILCGDFCQLCPVKDGYTFMAKTWGTTLNCCIELVENFRQKDDIEYAKILNQIRFGVYSDQAQDIIEQCKIPFDKREKSDDQINDDDNVYNNNLDKDTVSSEQSLEPHIVADDKQDTQEGDDDDGDDKNVKIESTMLYSTNKKVNQENHDRLMVLPGKMYHIRANDVIRNKMGRGGKSMKRTQSQLTYIKNRLENTDRPPACISLKVGAQVILTSNICTSRGLVNGARGVVKSFKKINAEYMPVVRFLCGEEMLMSRVPSDIRNEDEILATRSQIPLILGFACTIHKSQGMTIDLVEMSLTNCRNPGQVYTALSRASSTKGLYIDEFDEECIVVDKHVIEFYKGIHRKRLEELRIKREIERRKSQHFLPTS